MNASKTCAVLGANGFIGSAVTRAFLGAGYRVIACDRSYDFPALESHPNLETRTLDFLDAVAVREAMGGSDLVVHLVSTTKPAGSNENMAFDVETNIVPTLRLLEACKREGIERVLFASSGGTVYGVPERLPVKEDDPARPIVSYGLTKLSIERYAGLFERETGLRFISLRIGNPYGPRHADMRQGVIPVFIRLARQGLPLRVIGDGSTVRDYVHVDDVARAFLLAATYPGRERVFNIGSGKGRSVMDIIARIEAIHGSALRVEHLPARPFDIPAIVLDTGRALEHLGWRAAIPFEEGIRLTWEAM